MSTTEHNAYAPAAAPGRYEVLAPISFRGREYDYGDVVVQPDDDWEIDRDGRAVPGSEVPVPARFVDHLGGRWELVSGRGSGRLQAQRVAPKSSLVRPLEKGLIRPLDEKAYERRRSAAAQLVECDRQIREAENAARDRELEEYARKTNMDLDRLRERNDYERPLIRFGAAYKLLLDGDYAQITDKAEAFGIKTGASKGAFDV